MKKAWIILTWKLFNRRDVEVHNMLGSFFQDLNKDVPLVLEYFDKTLKGETVGKVDTQRMKDMVAVHVRLGDYVPEMRVDINWYREVIENIIKERPQQRFALFSDGSDEELRPLLTIPNVERCFFGNAFADMWAISKSKFVIASDSTFSAWGAFLGQRPILFSKRHFPPVYDGKVPEAVIGTTTNLPSDFMIYL
ncbi:alpha-1,2-fucosyltransferase [Bacteroides sp. AN502(2024)]|uniref:alpha-1,2-fucosyltransferase n=1 Tax=Bacteroides sp. AN502(2024) TaxID=3160599 RepID=UPI003513CC65